MSEKIKSINTGKNVKGVEMGMENHHPSRLIEITTVFVAGEKIMKSRKFELKKFCARIKYQKQNIFS